MQLNKENIEAYLLDWEEGNLSDAEVSAVKAFLQEHPELAELAEELTDDVRFAPSEVGFKGATALKVKDENQLPDFVEELCFKKAEGILNAEEEERYNQLAEQFDPVEKETQRFAQAVFTPELGLVYANKEELKKPVVVSLFPKWLAVAASVAVLIVAGVWFFQPTESSTATPLAKMESRNKVQPIEVKPASLPTQLERVKVKQYKTIQLEDTEPVYAEVEKETPIKEVEQLPTTPVEVQPIEVIELEDVDLASVETESLPVQELAMEVSGESQEISAKELIKQWGREKLNEAIPDKLKEDNGKVTFASAVEAISANRIQIEQGEGAPGRRSFRVAFGKFGIEKSGS